MNMPKHITTKAAMRRLLERSALPAPPVGERAETGSASGTAGVLITCLPSRLVVAFLFEGGRGLRREP